MLSFGTTGLAKRIAEDSGEDRYKKVGGVILVDIDASSHGTRTRTGLW